jgi:methylated-DNA-protein-cysteine methyltransferase related protein
MERRREQYLERLIDWRKGLSPAKRENPAYRERVYKIVRKIPSGKVMTYGQIAELLGEGYTPRTVGFCMHSSPDNTPWHRVVNASGGCSTLGIVLPHDKQQRMLESEGITFSKSGKCDLETFIWIPKVRAQREQTASLYKGKPSKSGAKR